MGDTSDKTARPLKTVKNNTQETRGDGTVAGLFRRYRDDIAVFVRKKVGAGPPDPDDIVQQTFATYAALRNPSKVDNPRAFLYRTASNLIADYFKSAFVRTSVPVEDGDFDEIVSETNELTPEIVLLSRERYTRVMDAIDALPRRRRRFLVMHRLQGLSYEEIARRSGVGTSTARREVEAAVGACRVAIEKMNEESDE